jgi:multidrug efflux system membrane fusion protein
MKRLFMLVVFLAVLGAAGGAFWLWQGGGTTDVKGKGAGKGGNALPVRAAQVVVKPMPVVIEAVGNVEAEQSVQLRAQVSGLLQAVHFKEGDRVKAGQLLFEIDPRTYQAQYNQALAALARDRAQLENAKVQQERLEPLLKREFITRQEYDVAVTSARSLEATVEADKAQVEQAKIQLEFARVHAPISGRTGALSLKAGNVITPGGGGSNLVTINNTDPVLVAFSIPERQLEELRRYQNDPGMKIEIVPSKGGPAVAEGKLVFVDNTVTPQTGTVLLKTRVPNSQDLLWPGQFVNVRIVLTTEAEALVVPEVAVQPGQSGPFVYAVVDGKVRIQPVQVSRQIGREVVIAAGLKAGDQVLTEIPQALSEGAAVQVVTGERGGKGEGKGKGKGEKSDKGDKDRAAAEGGSGDGKDVKDAAKGPEATGGK